MNDLGDEWWTREDEGERDELVSTADKPAPALVVISGHSAGLRYRVERRRVMVGRHAACDLMLQGSGVSRRHFELRRATDNTITILDLDSTNGTYVAGERIRGETPLTEGQEILIGAYTVLKFER